MIWKDYLKLRAIQSWRGHQKRPPPPPPPPQLPPPDAD